MKDDYRAKGLRRNLIKTLEAKGISDSKVLEAFMKVPRHYFFDDIFIEHAYEDKAFPIAAQQTISQPYTVAFQSSLLDIKQGEKVLEIGTGSGYQAAILCALGAEVYSIEVIKELYEKSRNLLRAMGYRLRQFQADGSKGLPVFAPFDKILVTAGGPRVPEALIEQLKIGGSLVIPVGDQETQKMIRVKKLDENKLVTENFGSFKFVPLTGEQGWR